LLLHIGVIVGVGIINTPSFPFDPSTVQARVLESTPIVPRFIVILEIAVYLAVRRMLIQNSKSYASALALRESELAVVRSQGNPHFMFNTLNLINAEISDDPENAKEILFDLADLLRKSLRLSQHTFTTVSEEAELAGLYLTLQKKRFKRRLTFDIDIDEAVRDMQCPALLLQPVIENAVKHAVAPYAAPAHIYLQATLRDHCLALIVKDTGPPFDESKVADGNGMRIVRKTLDLHYAGHYEMQLTSRESGGEFSIRIPSRALGVSNGRT
jgi:LytS/YehU family sensor histidine kinase